MNKYLTFLAAYGEENKTVEISQAVGGGGSYRISEDRLHQGSVILYYGDTWTVVSQKGDLTMDDKDAILDRMIEAGLITLESIRKKR